MSQIFKDYLSKLKTFSPEEIEAIAEHTQVEEFKKGSLLIREGDTCKSCFFVLKGCIRQYQIKDGKERTTGFYTENQTAILYSSYMQQEPSAYFLECMEDSILTTGTREQELKLHKQFPKLEYLTYSLLPNDYQRIQDQLATMLSMNAEERYLHLLENQPQLVQRVPLQHLASYIGVTPESFSRIRKRIMLKERQGK